MTSMLEHKFCFVNCIINQFLVALGTAKPSNWKNARSEMCVQLSGCFTREDALYKHRLLALEERLDSKIPPFEFL